MFWFEIDKGTLGRTKFETNADDGLNRLMCDIYKTVGNGDGENGGKGSLWNCATEIFKSLKNYETYEYAGCSWRVLPMTHEQFIGAKGWTLDEYRARIKGWLCRDNTVALDELRVDRYVLHHDKSFRQVHQLYVAAYEKDETIGTILDWLEDWPNVDEVNAALEV